MAVDTDKSILSISGGSREKEGVIKVNIVKRFYR